MVTNPIPGTTPNVLPNISASVGPGLGSIGSDVLNGGVLTALIEYAPLSTDGTFTFSFPESVLHPLSANYGARGGDSGSRFSGATTTSPTSGDSESKANDDAVVQELFDRPPDLSVFLQNDFLDSTDLAAGILTGARPRATLMLQKGRQAAPIGALVSDDGTDDGFFSDVPPEERLPRDHLLINPALPPGVRYRNPPLDEVLGPMSRGPDEVLPLRDLAFQEWAREEGRTSEEALQLAVGLAAGLLSARSERRPRPS